MLLMRIGAVFVAICMALIAASVGAVLYLSVGLGVWQASTAALATLVILVIVNSLTTRERDLGAVSDQIADLSRGASDVARQVAALDRRVAAMEGKVENSLSKTRAVTDPLAIELGELGTLVKQLAESLADHDAASARPYAMEQMRPVEMPPAEFTPAEADAGAAPAWATGGFATMPRDEITANLREAIDANRVDLYLQPIVTLPQRKVRYYEAMARLRLANGDLLPAIDFIPHAEAAALMPRIDNLMAFRCVQVVRRLLLKNRDIGVFCNIASSTLTDATVFPQLLEFMDANRAIASSLVLEFTQDAWRAMGPIEHEALEALAERGFRFSLDNMRDLHLGPRELAERHVRFVKMPGTLLLSQRGGAFASDIHPADLSDLLARSGIDLIADKIESEATVVDLLDYDVRFGQGFLFSQPRPVRAEALQGAPDSDLAGESMPSPAIAGDAPQKRPAIPRTGLAQLATSVVDRA